MTSPITNPSTPGEAPVAELLWVHDKIRHDLEVVHRLSAAVLAGAAPGAVAAAVAAAVDELQTNSPLWRLRVNCLYYCRLVHAHHTIEDVALFPKLRRTDPGLAPVVDRLEDDHRRVADHTDAIEALVKMLGRDDRPEHRQQLASTLDELATLLLEHLDYEEVQISPALLRWTGWG